MLSDKNDKGIGYTLDFSIIACLCIFRYIFFYAGIRNNYINIIDVPNMKSCGEFAAINFFNIYIFFQLKSFILLDTTCLVLMLLGL